MKYVRVVVFTGILILCMWGLSRVMLSEGRYFDGYEENYVQTKVGFDVLPSDSLDAIFIGSSNIFLNFSPLDLYADFGYKGYNLATPVQTLQQSYFVLKKALESQSPKYVFLDCLAFVGYYDNGEGYTHMVYDTYPLDKFKIEYMEETLPEAYDKRLFLFPFLLYHTRWNELNISDFDLYYYEEKEDFLGYSPAFSVKAYEEKEKEEEHDFEDIKIWPKDVESLERIIALCDENDCKLVLMKTPCNLWYKEASEKMKEVSLKYGLEFWDFSDLDIINKETDYCDGGGHLNDFGVQKLTCEIGKRMQSEFGTEWVTSTDEINKYFAGRLNNLEKCRKIQGLIYEYSYSEIVTRLKDDDYIILLNGDESEWANRCINEITNISNNIFSEGEKISVFVNNSEGMGTYYKNNEELIIEEYGHTFFLTFIDNKSIIQMDYYNYSSEKEGGLHIAVYDKYYDCIIDIINIYYIDNDLVISHLNN